MRPFMFRTRSPWSSPAVAHITPQRFISHDPQFIVGMGRGRATYSRHTTHLRHIPFSLSPTRSIQPRTLPSDPTPSESYNVFHRTLSNPLARLRHEVLSRTVHARTAHAPLAPARSGQLMGRASNENGELTLNRDPHVEVFCRTEVRQHYKSRGSK